MLCLVQVGIEPLLLLVPIGCQICWQGEGSTGRSHTTPGSCLTGLWERHHVSIFTKITICWAVSVWVCGPLVLKQVDLVKNKIISNRQMLAKMPCFGWNGIILWAHCRSSLFPLGATAEQTPRHYFISKLTCISPAMRKLACTLLFFSTQKASLTAWHRMGCLVRLMPPANTVKVRAAWKQKLRSACRPFRLIRIALWKTKISH